jgi:mono/diheme cytochrome c family protein
MTAAALLLLCVAGCSMSSAPQFRLNTEGRNPASISRTQGEAIGEALGGLFGTPDEPKVPTGVELDLKRLRAAAGPIAGDAQGNQRGLFRRHCAACHGTAGDGAGPTAGVLNPYPRDFRNGVFKFTSTAGGAKPLRDDLLRTLREGLPGTAMPSFRNLPDRELDALLEYVKYLSIRGQTELSLLQKVVDEDAALPVPTHEVLADDVLPAARSWDEARGLAIVPPPPPSTDTPEQLAASIAQGDQLFHGPESQCVKCHGPLGDGRGQQAELYDDWNLRKKGATPEETRSLAGRFRLPIQRVRPRNFTLESFRGGQRPIDQYWRIAGGIKGTPMPPAGPAPGSPAVLRPDDIWHLVNYVRSLRGHRPPDNKKIPSPLAISSPRPTSGRGDRITVTVSSWVAPIALLSGCRQAQEVPAPREK